VTLRHSLVTAASRLSSLASDAIDKLFDEALRYDLTSKLCGACISAFHAWENGKSNISSILKFGKDFSPIQIELFALRPQSPESMNFD